METFSSASSLSASALSASALSASALSASGHGLPSAGQPLRLVIAILTDAGAVDALLTRWAEHDVRGATVLDARGMAEHLSAHLSLFAGFKAAFAAVGHSQVVMTVIPASRCAEILALAVEAGDLRRPGTGIAFALDVADAVGLTKEQ